jgi:hypothetical protein
MGNRDKWKGAIWENSKGREAIWETREKGTGPIWESTGNYNSLVVLGRARRESSGGVGRVTGGGRFTFSTV